MAQAHNIVIHEFGPSTMTLYDDEGDEMFGFYFQFTDIDDEPVSDFIGPYGYNSAAERAALRAFKAKDY